MKKSNALGISIGILGTIGLLVTLLYFFSPDRSKKRKLIHWEENYKNTSRDPYGLSVLFELLKSYNQGQEVITVQKPLYKTLHRTSSGEDNYVFIGNDLYLGKKDIDSLLQFVSEGNTAFICSKEFPYNLMDTLHDENCSNSGSHYSRVDSIVTMNFLHKDLKTEKGYVFKAPRKPFTSSANYEWNGTDGNYFCDSSYRWIKLGYIRDRKGDEYVNFIEFAHGQGKFIFHTNPAVFANYYLLDKNHLEYADKVLSHLDRGKIYWDEYSKLPYMDKKGQGNGDDSGQSDLRAGPLELILKNDSLRFAWYLLLVLVILYIIFFGKRKQRIIPVLHQNVNTSLEFIKTVGTLYLKQNNHRRLMLLKLKLFLNFIRQRYQLPTTILDAAFIQKVSQKSNIAEEHIREIVKETTMVNRYNVVEAQHLYRLHELLDFFYKNCK